jgi:hypothetical protein
MYEQRIKEIPSVSKYFAEFFLAQKHGGGENPKIEPRGPDAAPMYNAAPKQSNRAEGCGPAPL